MATGTIQSQFIVPARQFGIANNSSRTFSFPSGCRAVIFASGVGNARGMVVVTTTSSSATNYTEVSSASGLALSTSGLDLTITNTSGGYAYLLVLAISGDLPTAD